MESSFVQFLTVIVIFVFVLAITVLTTKFVGGFQKKTMSGKNITVIETCRIAPNKFVQIVKIGERFFALAIGKDTVQTIGELTADEIHFDAASETPYLGFQEMLNKAKERMQKK